MHAAKLDEVAPLEGEKSRDAVRIRSRVHTFVDVRGVCLLPRLVALFLVARGRGGFLARFLLLSGCLACRGLAAGGGLLLSSFWRHSG